MKFTPTLLLLTVGISMVMADGLPCPRECTHPKSKAECDQCLNEGYSDIVLGRGGAKPIDKMVGKMLKPGAWTQWEGNRCWIHLLGLGQNDCGDVSTHLFGNGRCAGYAGHEYNALSGRCWAKYKA